MSRVTRYAQVLVPFNALRDHQVSDSAVVTSVVGFCAISHRPRRGHLVIPARHPDGWLSMTLSNYGYNIC
jgi:hypothetical protein